MRRTWSSEEGSSLIEVAILMPLLVLILVGAVDFGQAYYVGIEVASAAQAGTAYGVMNSNDTAGMQTAAAIDASDVPVMTSVAAWGCECSDGTGASVSCTVTPSCGTNLVDYVDVTTTASFTPILRYPGVPSVFMLSGHSRMRVAP